MRPQDRPMSFRAYACTILALGPIGLGDGVELLECKVHNGTHPGLAISGRNTDPGRLEKGSLFQNYQSQYHSCLYH